MHCSFFTKTSALEPDIHTDRAVNRGTYDLHAVAVNSFGSKLSAKKVV